MFPSRPPATALASLLFPLLGASLALSACSENAPPPPPPGPVPVTVVTLEPTSVLLTRELPGRTSAFLVAEVRPQATGIIKRRLFTEGGLVKEGQPLYELDASTYRADHASALAVLERARASLSVAEVEANRANELARSKVISEQEHDRIRGALLTAAADVKAAEANSQRAALMLGYARISSPITGRIGKSAFTQGALVTANQPQALASVQQLDPIYVDLTQSSAELLELRKEVSSGGLESSDGTPVTLFLEDGSQYAHQGKLAFSDVTVNPGTGTFLLRVVVPNPDGLLLPGMYVRARIGEGRRKDGLLVPQQGIARDPKGNASALLVGKDGKVEPREVKVSRAIGDDWLVEEGLNKGDRVIVEGLQKIGPGTPVEATEATPAGSANTTPQ